ncbi:DNA-3-methyladenine glycosylase [Chryseolinea sp. H1M3-3]|uniref:DNA-3-methyladenine glycosylase family protein n=1 Tax=Chryseolinea sp. H1M3-3 TaxID=3034144 RepID=UPI0023EAE83A|nr:DNA-3-methyladenine glycosylase [Chryseolinea sp. H1M3-3]
MKSLRIPPPQEFSYELALTFLKRSPRELLHKVVEDRIEKALRIDDAIIIFSIHYDEQDLIVDFLNTNVTVAQATEVVKYIREWLDLDTDLKPFYVMCQKDKLLKGLVESFYGYRIVGQPDLFESIVWAVLGQQINLQFAYTLKQRFVEQFGEEVTLKEETYYLFPTPDAVARLTPEQLLPLQFSRQKAAYTINIAQAFAKGHVSKEKLVNLPLKEAKELLMKIKGIGNWTANYALMKTFRHADAFPLEDAGIHNAIKNLKKLKRKPTLEEVKKIFKKYKGWEAYATLYLWKSL